MRMLSLLCAFLLMMSATLSAQPAVAQTAEEAHSVHASCFPGLDFDARGEFVLCQITDMHEYYPVNEEAFRLLDENLGRVHPSLAIITGDNTWLFGNRESFPKVVERIVALLRKHNIRFAVTFGNHDSQKTGPELMDRQEQYDCFKKLGGELFVDFDVPELYGVGNGAIALRQNGEDKFLLVIMDDADTPKIPWGEYLCDDAQIRWYEENASHLPCLWFQHVIVWDVYEDGLLQEVAPVQEAHPQFLETVDAAKEDPNAFYSEPLGKHIQPLPQGAVWLPEVERYAIPVPGMAWVPALGKYMLGADGSLWCPMVEKFLKLAPGVTGQMKEPPCPPRKIVYESELYTYQGRTLYQSWLKCGNMKGAFFGHDHVNDFLGTDKNGITLGYTKSATLSGYNDANPGVRYFRVHADGTYTTWQITATDLRENP